MRKEMKKNQSWGIASLVCGIVSILIVIMPYFGLPLAIMAMVGAAKQLKQGENGTATAGRILGIIGIVINSIMLFFVLIYLMFMSSFIAMGL